MKQLKYAVEALFYYYYYSSFI